MIAGILLNSLTAKTPSVGRSSCRDNQFVFVSCREQLVSLGWLCRADGGAPGLWWGCAVGAVRLLGSGGRLGGIPIIIENLLRSF